MNHNKVVSQRGFTNTCSSLQKDDKAIALFITHLLDPVPTEVHVFWSAWADKSMYVFTPPDGSMWAIEGGKIRFVRKGEASG